MHTYIVLLENYSCCLSSSTSREGNVPDSHETQGHVPHCGGAEQIQDGIGTL